MKLALRVCCEWDDEILWDVLIRDENCEYFQDVKAEISFISKVHLCDFDGRKAMSPGPDMKKIR